MGKAVEVSAADDEAESATVNVFHVAEDCLTEPSKFAMTYRVVDETGVDEG